MPGCGCIFTGRAPRRKGALRPLVRPASASESGGTIQRRNHPAQVSVARRQRRQPTAPKRDVADTFVGMRSNPQATAGKHRRSQYQKPLCPRKAHSTRAEPLPSALLRACLAAFFERIRANRGAYDAEVPAPRSLPPPSAAHRRPCYPKQHRRVSPWISTKACETRHLPPAPGDETGKNCGQLQKKQRLEKSF